ncbi:hypothetical protein Tco_0759239 [Tanacetum coccineum]
MAIGQYGDVMVLVDWLSCSDYGRGGAMLRSGGCSVGGGSRSRLDTAYPCIRYGVLGISWSKDHERIRRILLDGYGVLVFRTVCMFEVSTIHDDDSAELVSEGANGFIKVSLSNSTSSSLFGSSTFVEEEMLIHCLVKYLVMDHLDQWW